jgi:predicted ATPase
MEPARQLDFPPYRLDLANEQLWDVELHRLRGELFLRQGAPSAYPNAFLRHFPGNNQASAEACFLKAIALARKQQAKALELRATLSLVHLWLQRGKHEQAQRMLTEIYHWFTEGFNTADLQEAQALLDELQ